MIQPTIVCTFIRTPRDPSQRGIDKNRPLLDCSAVQCLWSSGHSTGDLTDRFWERSHFVTYFLSVPLFILSLSLSLFLSVSLTSSFSRRSSTRLIVLILRLVLIPSLSQYCSCQFEPISPYLLSLSFPTNLLFLFSFIPWPLLALKNITLFSRNFNA